MTVLDGTNGSHQCTRPPLVSLMPGITLLLVATFVVAGCAGPVNSPGSTGAGTSGGSTFAPTVYAGGYSINSAGVQIPGYWTDNSGSSAWVGFPTLDASHNSGVTSLLYNVSNGYFYAAGYSDDSSGVENAGYWSSGDGKTFTWYGNLTVNPAGAYNAEIASFAVTPVENFAAGYAVNSGNVEVPGYWSTFDGTWYPATVLDSTRNSRVTAEYVDDGTGIPYLYESGYSTNSSGVQVPGFWVWSSVNTNSTWHQLQVLDASANSEVTSMTVSLAGGFSTDSSGVKVPGYWMTGGATSSWVGLSPLDASADSEVTSLAVSGTETYAAGYSTNASGVQIAGYWACSGGSCSWVGLPSLSSSANSEVTTLAVSGSEVYAGGFSTDSTGVQVAGYWMSDGTTSAWFALPALDAADNSEVTSLALSN